MNKFFKKYIGIIIAWVVVAIAAIFVMPNSLNLVASHGQTKLPSLPKVRLLIPLRITGVQSSAIRDRCWLFSVMVKQN
ncbi:hypothetical protein JCM14108_1997 [Lentilactobacillus farraginis DSM 18382 = JCM 14108]|uniref:Uncharacterized protein n=1 Tax=Lentilactobacillus farraginis DSM 18382 = JCM 14108 TaxID=1423743 RepID=X0PB13_9LACO|nr:hypothetical protein JCM14108_1997 [Lentilactobacillus farraginis DSM 18382 = JCM 14108]